MRTERRNLYIFSFSLLLPLVVFYAPFLSNTQSYYLSDLTYYYEPMLRWMGSALKSNHLPIWNPYSYCGMPQAANPSPGILYPPDWLFAYLPFSPALAIYMILHQMAAGVGAYLLIAGLGWGGFAAATGGITLALCGYMFSLQKNFPLVASAAWLPLVIWSLRKIGAGISASHYVQVIVATGSVYLLLATGKPEIVLPCLLLAFAYIAQSAYASAVLDRLGRSTLKSTLWRITSVVLATLLAMPIILPTMEWTALSPRSHGLSLQESLLWSSNWYDCLTLVLAQPLGDLNLLGAKFLQLVATRPGFIPYLSSAYVGPLVITLSIWGALDRRWSARWLVLFLLAATTVATLGDRTAIMPALMHQFPTLGSFRYPVKMIILPVWCIVLLAARGACLSVSVKPDRVARLCAWAFWIFFGFVMAVLAITPRLGWIAPHLRLLSLPVADISLVTAGLAAIAKAGLVAAFTGLASCLVAELYFRDKLARPAFQATFLAGISASLLACAFLYSRHGTEQNFFQHDSQAGNEIRKLAADEKAGSNFRILSLYFDPLTVPPWYDGQSKEDVSSRFYQYGRQLLLPTTNMDFGFASSFGYEAAETADYRKIFGAAYRAYLSNCRTAGEAVPAHEVTGLSALARFCEITATRYVLTQVYSDTGPVKNLPILDSRLFILLSDNRAENLRIYRLNKSLPRAYLTGQWRWCDRHDEAVSLMEGSDQSQLSPPDWLLLEHKSPYSARYDPKIEPAGSAALKGSWLTFMQNEAEHVSLSVKTRASCFVVLADHFYPGWHAKVDGMPAELYCADAVIRAVFVRPGSHLIEFDYDPDSFYDGQKLATAALVILAILAAVAVFIKLAESVRPKLEE